MTTSHADMSPAGLNILTFQPRITVKDHVGRIARSQHTQDMFDSESATSNDRLPTENLRVHRDAFEKELFIHDETSLARMIAH